MSGVEKERSGGEKEIVSGGEKERRKEKTTEKTTTQEANPSAASDQNVACPVCGEVFSSHTTLRQRTAHVEACLQRASSREATPSTPKTAVEDDLWEEEASQPQANRRVDVEGMRGRRVIHDDGDDACYRALLFSYLQWRASSASPAGEALRVQYRTAADAIYEWVPGARTPKEKEVAEALDRFYRTEPAVVLPSGYAMPRHLWGVLYPYQRRGVEWLLGLHAQGVGGIVADEMGLGKTLQIVAALVALKFSRELIRRGRDIRSLPRAEEGTDENESGGDDSPTNIENTITHSTDNTIASIHTPSNSAVDLNPHDLPTLLIVPATLLGHWLRELRHWCPLLRSVVMHSTSQTVADGTSLRSILLQCRSKHRYDVIITTYEGIRLSTLYTKQDWFYAILDEGGKIKNAKVGVSRACKQLRTVHRLLISGTPLQNNLKELWSLVDFVFPGRLGTIEAFVSSFVIPISRGIYSNATRQASNLGYQCSLMLQDSVSPFILRRLKKDVKKELPPKTEQVLSCLLSPLQEKKYLEYLQSEQVQSSLLGRVMPFKAIIRLRQICNHPVFYQSLAKMGATTEREKEPTRLRHVDGMFYKPEYEKTTRQEEEEEVIDYDTVDWREWAPKLKDDA